MSLRRNPTETALIRAPIDEDRRGLAVVADAWSRTGPGNARQWYEDALVQWLATSQSDHTRRSYARTVRHFFEWLSWHRGQGRLIAPHEVTLGDITAYARAIAGTSTDAYPDLLGEGLIRSLVNLVRAKGKERLGPIPFRELESEGVALMSPYDYRETTPQQALLSYLGKAAKMGYVHRLPKIRDPEISRQSKTGSIVRYDPFEPLDPYIFSFAPVTERPPAQPSTVAQRLSALSSFFGAMCRPNPALGESPVKGNPVSWELAKWHAKRRENAEERTQARKTRPEDLRLLLEIVDKVDVHPTRKMRDLLVIKMLYMMGLRVSELCGATNADLDEKHPSGPVLKVRRKRSKVQSLGVPATVMMALRTFREALSKSGLEPGYIEMARLPEAPLVSGLKRWGAASHGDGTMAALVPMTQDGIREIFRRYIQAHAPDDPAQQAALMERIHPHGLRHLFAAQALTVAPIQVVQKYMGHSSPTTTGIYAPQVDTTRVLGEDALLSVMRQAPPAVEIKEPVNIPPPQPVTARKEPASADIIESPIASAEHVPLQSMDAVTDIKPPSEPERTIRAIGEALPGAAKPKINTLFEPNPSWAYTRDLFVPGKGGRAERLSVSAKGLPLVVQNARFMTGDMTLLPYRVYRGGLPGKGDTKYILPVPRVDRNSGDGFLDELALKLVDLHEQMLGYKATDQKDPNVALRPTAAATMVEWVKIMLIAGRALGAAMSSTGMSWMDFGQAVTEESSWEDAKNKLVRSHSADGIAWWIDTYGDRLTGSFDPSRDPYEYAVERGEERYVQGTRKGYTVAGKRKEATSGRSAKRSREYAGLGYISYNIPDWMYVEDPLGDAEHGVKQSDRKAFSEWLFSVTHTRAPVWMPSDEYDINHDTLKEVLKSLSPWVGAANAPKHRKKSDDWMSEATRDKIRNLCFKLEGGIPFVDVSGRSHKRFDPYAISPSNWRSAAFTIAGEIDKYEAGVPVFLFIGANEEDDEVMNSTAYKVFSMLQSIYKEERKDPKTGIVTYVKRGANRFSQARCTIEFTEQERIEFAEKHGVDPQLVARRIVRLLWERRAAVLLSGEDLKRQKAPMPRSTEPRKLGRPLPDVGMDKFESDFDLALAWKFPAPSNIEFAIGQVQRRAGKKMTIEEMKSVLIGIDFDTDVEVPKLARFLRLSEMDEDSLEFAEEKARMSKQEQEEFRDFMIERERQEQIGQFSFVASGQDVTPQFAEVASGEQQRRVSAREVVSKGRYGEGPRERAQRAAREAPVEETKKEETAARQRPVVRPKKAGEAAPEPPAPALPATSAASLGKKARTYEEFEKQTAGKTVKEVRAMERELVKSFSDDEWESFKDATLGILSTRNYDDDLGRLERYRNEAVMKKNARRVLHAGHIVVPMSGFRPNTSITLPPKPTDSAPTNPIAEAFVLFT